MNHLESSMNISFNAYIPIRLSHIFERCIQEGSGVVDKDVNSSILLHGSLCNSVSALDLVVVSHSLSSSILNLYHVNKIDTYTGLLHLPSES